MTFAVGDKVIKNPVTWVANDFDAWGRGVGVGLVVEAPFPIDDLGLVDVRWPAGCCAERCDGLLPHRDAKSRSG
jgi:hypothetical protein